MEAQQIKTIVERALVSYSGTTTGDGAAGGNTVVCSGLTTQPDYNRLSVLISEGAYAGLTADIVGSTTGGTINVEPSFPGQIVSGINFHIIPRLPAYSELVDIMGSGFDTGTDSLVKLHDDHITEITSARMAELDAANIPADIDLLKKQILTSGAVSDVTPAAGNFDTDLAEATNDHFNNMAIVFTSGALLGQARRISDYDGTAKNIIVLPAFTEAPANADTFVIISAYLDVMVERLDTQAKADVNVEVDGALDTAIPGTPTAHSINERIKAIDLLTESGGGGDLAAILADTNELQGLIAASKIAAQVKGLDNIDLSATMKTSVNTEVDNALDTAIPGSPTAGSINERIKTLDEAYTATRAGYLDELAAANMPADLDTVKGLVDSGEAAGPYSYLDAGGEQDVVEDTATTRRRIWLEFSNRNMTQTGTFKVYRKVDGTNYDLWATIAATVAAGDDRAWDAEFTTNQAWKLTYEEGADEGAARAIPYNVITQVIE